MSSLAHFTGVFILSNVGVSLSVYYFGCGRPEHRTGRSKHPRFFYVVNQRKKLTRSHWVFADNDE